jgi:hypothetical protein
MIGMITWYKKFRIQPDIPFIFHATTWKKEFCCMKRDVHEAMFKDTKLKLNISIMWHFQAQWENSILV